jgi:hypothetical protein
MSRIAKFTLALAVGLAALVLVSAARRATAEEEGARLSLTTGYLFERVDVAQRRFGGHWLRVDVTLDNSGGGKGRLEIDPNIQGYNAFGDPTSVTEMAPLSLDVTLEAVKVDDPANKGRRLYELKGQGINARLFLVVSPREARPSRLIVQGKDRTAVFPLKDAGDRQ